MEIQPCFGVLRCLVQWTQLHASLHDWSLQTSLGKSVWSYLGAESHCVLPLHWPFLLAHSGICGGAAADRAFTGKIIQTINIHHLKRTLVLKGHADPSGNYQLLALLDLLQTGRPAELVWLNRAEPVQLHLKTILECLFPGFVVPRQFHKDIPGNLRTAAVLQVRLPFLRTQLEANLHTRPVA